MFVTFTASANGKPIIVNADQVQWAGDNGNGAFIKFSADQSIAVEGSLTQVRDTLNEAVRG